MKRVPELRFGEFSGEWEENKLLNLSENGFSNGAFNDPKKVGEGYRIINVKDMYVDGTIQVEKLTRVALDDKEFANNRVDYGDIFFTRSSLVKEGIAHSNVNLTSHIDLTYDGHLIKMKPKKDICSPIFLYYNFITSHSRKQFIIRGKTTTMTTIGQSDIASVKIIIPSKQEQEKIASFLSSVDSSIEQLTKKEKLLREYKKGVMQKIFNQEVRFKNDDGSGFPEWVETKLGEVSKITTGSSNREDSSLDGEYTFFDRSEDIRTSDIFLFDGEAVIVAGEGQQFIPKYFIGKFDLHQRTYAIMQFNGAVGKFIYYLIYKNQNYFLSQAVGSTVKSLRLPMFQKMSINLPSLKEQTKIANFLSSLDTKIEQANQQLKLTKEFKKALLQQMFV